MKKSKSIVFGIFHLIILVKSDKIYLFLKADFSSVPYNLKKTRRT